MICPSKTILQTKHSKIWWRNKSPLRVEYLKICLPFVVISLAGIHSETSGGSHWKISIPKSAQIMVLPNISQSYMHLISYQTTSWTINDCINTKTFCHRLKEIHGSTLPSVKKRHAFNSGNNRLAFFLFFAISPTHRVIQRACPPKECRKGGWVQCCQLNL